ncbi:MAG: PEGA domain-containing protein [Candidatus Gottesmanbacteria bacterium]
MVKFKNTAFFLFTVCIILIVSVIVIMYGRGYRFNVKQKTFGSTGLITATSDPIGATIFIDNKKIGATNTTITVKPGWYMISFMKEGYQPWGKKLRVQGEVVAQANGTLFPTNPSLSAITTSGVSNPVLSPDGGKLAFVVPTIPEAPDTAQLTQKSGIWVLDLIDKPLGLNRDARQILKSKPLDVSKAVLSWSPDSKQLLIDVPTAQKTTASYLVDTDKLNDFAKPVYIRRDIINDWAITEHSKETEKLSTLAPNFITVATNSMKIIAFSPDERNILYEATTAATIPQIITPPLIGSNPTEDVRTIKPYSIYTYDIKEDRNYLIGNANDLDLQWLPTSRHLITISKDKIEAMDYDGINRKTVYAGPFWDAFVAPWTNASKLVILTNLNPTASTLPNLYVINIR